MNKNIYLLIVLWVTIFPSKVLSGVNKSNPFLSESLLYKSLANEVSLTKAVYPAIIQDQDVATYTWTLRNTGAGSVKQSGLGFVDKLPDVLRAVSPLTVEYSGWETNPVVSLIDGDLKVVVSGGVIAAGATGTIKLKITNVSGFVGNCSNDASFLSNASHIESHSPNILNEIGEVCLEVILCGMQCKNIVKNGSFDSDLANWDVGFWRLNPNGYATVLSKEAAPTVLSQSVSGLHKSGVANQVRVEFTIFLSGNGESGILEVTLGGSTYGIIKTSSGLTAEIQNKNGGQLSINPNPYIYKLGLGTTSANVALDIPWSSSTMPDASVLGFAFTGHSQGDEVGIDDVKIDVCESNIPETPVLSVLTQPTCTSNFGTFKVTEYNPAYRYFVTPDAGVTRNGDTFTAPPGVYTVRVSRDICKSLPSIAIRIRQSSIAPATPVFSNVIQPTCAVGTGSFTIANYDASYTYTVSPASGVTMNGASVLAGSGTYTLTASKDGCVSSPSLAVIINPAPTTPTTPLLSNLVHPTCKVGTGSFTITNYDASYTYTVSPSSGVTRNGASVVAGSGTYTLTASKDGCVSSPSLAVIINPAPTTPTTPLLAVLVQPTCTKNIGSFTITNYDESYTYTISPASGTTRNGSKIDAIAGTYIVTASKDGCVSAPSTGVVINPAPNVPEAPNIAVTNPTCQEQSGIITVLAPIAGAIYELNPLGISNSTGKFINLPAESGSYTVTSTVNFCTSSPSNSVNIGPIATGCCAADAGVISTTLGVECISAGTSIPIAINGNNTEDGYFTVFVLTSENGIILREVKPGFNSPAVNGNYLVYAINYSTQFGGSQPVITQGLNINNIGGTCTKISSKPISFCVKYGCTEVGQAINFIASGQNEKPGYITKYVLTNSQGFVLSVHNSSPITAPLISEQYRIYAVNFKEAESPDLKAGANLLTQGKACTTVLSDPIKICVSNALPVEIVSFTVHKIEHGKAKLNWTTTTDATLESYAIERSIDVKNWSTIAMKVAPAQKGSFLDYQYIDDEPLKGGVSDGVNYYRLKMFYSNNTFTYSRIRDVKFDAILGDLILFPNPAHEELYIKDPENRTLKSVRVINVQGIQVLEASQSELMTRLIRLKGLQSGVYVVNVVLSDDTEHVSKIIVKAN